MLEELIPVHPAVFAIGIFVLFIIFVMVALCHAAAQGDEELEERRQIERELRDIEQGRWPT